MSPMIGKWQLTYEWNETKYPSDTTFEIKPDNTLDLFYPEGQTTGDWVHLDEYFLMQLDYNGNAVFAGFYSKSDDTVQGVMTLFDGKNGNWKAERIN